MDYFWSPNKGFMYGAKKEEEGRRGRRGRSQKVWKLRVFVWILVYMTLV